LYLSALSRSLCRSCLAAILESRKDRTNV
jgi:hypothetical protein